MKILILILCLVSLTAFADSAILNDYINDRSPKLKSGEIKESEYYQGMYEVMEKSDIPHKGENLVAVTEFLENALNFEIGKITKQEHDLFKMKKRAQLMARDESEKQKIDHEQINQQNARNAELRKELPPYLAQPKIKCQTNQYGSQTNTTCQ